MFQDANMRKVMTLVGVAAIVALGAYTYYAITQARYMTHMPVTISVTGNGEVLATPDLATFNFNVNAKEADAATAQTKSAEIMGKILTYLKENGVEEKDIKTEYYNLSPRYEYPEVRCMDWGCPPQSEPTLIGYEVSQSVTVKVRKTDDAGKLVSGVGDFGAQNVSSLSFTIDDDESLKAEAREAAIADAKAKAEKLANDLGVRIVRMSGYWEEENGGYPIYGMGGGMDAVKTASYDRAESAPQELPTGENTITSRVNVTYEIR